MYNLSPRFLLPSSQTGVLLGPSYYLLDEVAAIKESYAPFSSNTYRKPFVPTTYTEAIYGPVDQHKIIGGSSMQNRAPRVTFAQTTSNKKEFPKEDFEKDEELIKQKSTILKPPPRRTRKLYVCKVPFYNDVKGPSVPSHMDDNGYTVDENDKLIKNPPDVVDTTLGPARYCVNQCANMSKRMYGGCKWSARTEPRRTIFALNDFPGPGSYDVNEKREDPAAELTARAREMAVGMSYNPRMMESIQNQTLREDFPGPPDYNIQKPLITRTTNKYAGFNMSARRFKSANDDRPGPGDYELRSTLIRKKVSQSETGFGCKVLSSKRKKKAGVEKPGVGTYDLARFPSSSKFLQYRTVPFGTGATRDFFIPDDHPGPSDYNTIPKKDDSKPSAIFRTNRARLEEIVQSHPNATCATYNIRDDFNRLKARRSFARKEVSFSSTQERVAFKPRDGPSFSMEETEKPKKGFAIARIPRFAHFDNGVPGPNAYLIQQSVASSMYKSAATFNIRLKENVIGSKLRLAPKHTRVAWYKEKTKRKMLRVFNRPEIQCMESWMEL